MTSKWLKASIALLGTVMSLSAAGESRAQEKEFSAQKPSPTNAVFSNKVEYQGLINFTKAVPGDLKSGQEDLQTLMRLAITTIFADSGPGFANVGAESEKDTKESFAGIPMVLSAILMPSVIEKEGIAAQNLKDSNYNTEQTGFLPTLMQGRSSSKIIEIENLGIDKAPFQLFSNLLQASMTSRDNKTAEFQNPFEWK